MTANAPRIVNISAEMVQAAQAADLKWRPARGNWRAVPDDQVARLLTGAYDLIAEQERASIFGQLGERCECDCHQAAHPAPAVDMGFLSLPAGVQDDLGHGTADHPGGRDELDEYVAGASSEFRAALDQARSTAHGGDQ